MTSVALPPEQAVEVLPGGGPPMPPEGAMQSGKLDVTPVQQAFLDALGAVGVRPSSQLRALSIGSSICQARAAGQSDQAVWDYVAPMVRSDVADARALSPQTATDIKVDAATADYIRIATQRLC